MASLAIAAAFSGTFSAAGLGISALGMSGAAVGWAVGSAVATVLLRPEVPDQEGPRLSDLSVQSSAYGSPLPKYYGDKSRGAGELIWSSGLDEKTHEEDIGGKGGGGTATTYSYSSSFAISIGEGPIAGVRRIWANGKLIFTGDPSADPADLVASRKVSAGLTIYNGTDTQEPDPTIEAYEGETPAYRGTAYVVFTDLDLTNYGNRIPNITFGVVPVGSLVEPGRIKQTKPAAINYSGMVITSVEDGVVRVLDLDNDIIHLLSGDSTPIGSTTVSASDYFPEDGIGVLSGYDVYIDGLFNSLDTGFEMWASNPSLGGGSSGGIDLTEAITQDKDKVFPIGISLCVDNSCVLLITNQTSVTQTNADEWWLIEINSENTASVLIESGTCSSMPGDINSYGFGNRGYFHFNSFSLESNREYAWAVNGWGYGNVRCYQKSGTSLTLLFDLISGIPVPYAHKPTIYADDGIAWVAASNYTAAFTRNERITTDLVSVGSVVSDICIDSGLSESDIDVTDLTDAVGGYVRTRPMTARAAIEPLMMAYYFDAVESDGKIKFVKRGGSSAVTIDIDELGAHEYGQDSGENFQTTRQQEVELTQQVSITYMDSGADFAQGTQRSRRLVTDSKHQKIYNLPISMTANKARQIAEVIHYDGWTARNTHPLSMGIKYTYLEPTDIITVDRGNSSHILRLAGPVDFGDPGINSSLCVDEDISVYTTDATGEALPDSGVSSIGETGPTDGYVLDVPLLRDVDDGTGVYIAARGYLDGWNGCVVYRSADDGTTWQQVKAFSSGAGLTVGHLTEALSSGVTTTWDKDNTIKISVKSGTPESATSELEVLNAGNALLIQAGDEWEVAQYETATDQGGDIWHLDNLLRGRKGTEHLVDQHSIGDAVLFVSYSKIQRLALSADDIGADVLYQFVSVGSNLVTSSPYTSGTVSLNLTDIGEKPYSPTHITGSRDGSNNLTIDWVRRGRIDNNWRDGVDVPTGEDTEAYEVDIMDGSTVKRTISIASETASYSAADQTTDGFTPGDVITVNIYQLSAVVGRGFVGVATV